MSIDAVSALEKATQGMLYMSETDAPFRILAWKDDGGAITAKKILEFGQHDPKTKVQELTLDEFLGDYAEGDDEDARRYRNLLQVIRDHLSDVRVFKVGQVNIDVYIVGRTKDGELVGLQTKAVET